jgi:hypothetical protein
MNVQQGSTRGRTRGCGSKQRPLLHYLNSPFRSGAFGQEMVWGVKDRRLPCLTAK